MAPRRQETLDTRLDLPVARRHLQRRLRQAGRDPCLQARARGGQLYLYHVRPAETHVFSTIFVGYEQPEPPKRKRCTYLQDRHQSRLERD